MLPKISKQISRSLYDREACEIGLVHLGFGAFHRAHQAVYLDDYMEKTKDLNWGIAAVNLRHEETQNFQNSAMNDDGYLLKTTSPTGECDYRLVRSHIQFKNWVENPDSAIALLAKPSVKALSMTVTESGYYLDDDLSLDLQNPLIASEIAGGEKRSVYAYLADALSRRQATIDAPISILSCDNIRANGDLLAQNFSQYLGATGQHELLQWVMRKASFPNSMVDRITPRSTPQLVDEISALTPEYAETAIHGESYIQWVLENNFAAKFPDLQQVGVEIVSDVHPFEEAKIRILNGGHTALCYLAALAGYQTFDQAMNDPGLHEHFMGFELDNVLPSLDYYVPFDRQQYVEQIAQRFANTAIADDLARICMDGWSKFSIFIQPTIKSCLDKGIRPNWGYESIASWYVYLRRFQQGKTPIVYVDPYAERLFPLLAHGREADFAQLEILWFDLPKKHPEFVPEIIAAIARIEEKWPA